MKNITAQELKISLEKGEPYYLIDVRSAAEQASTGVIPGSTCVPLEQIGDLAGNVNKSTNYVFVCLSGMRSQKAASTFEGLGFQNVYSLSGGITSWVQNRYKVVTKG
jgi:rhodanese-related sulfurtransferase